jgi:hypothetical protein
MNAFELTKSEKKLARQLIEKGLQIEYKKGLEQQSEIIEQWKSGNTDTKDSYLKLYQSVTSYDKYIAKRYDNIRGSKYLFIIAAQLADGIITLEEIEKFRIDTKNRLLLLSGINEAD